MSAKECERDIVTFSTTSACMAAAAIVQFGVLSGGAPSPDQKASLVLGIMVCVIAFLHYIYMQSSIENVERVTQLRYSDWVVTTPLLLVEFLFILGMSDAASWKEEWPKVLVLLGTCVAMVECGRRAEVDYGVVSNRAWFGAGCVFGVACATFFLWTAIPRVTRSNWWILLFAGLWIAYPLAYALPHGTRDVAYNVLDIFTKAAMGLVLSLEYALASG